MSPVERVEVRRLALRLREPFRSAAGEVSVRRVLLVCLHARPSAGAPAGVGPGVLVGYGECSALEEAGYAGETIEQADAALREVLVPLVLERRLVPGDFGPALEAAAPDRPFARAALEMAGWDLKARGLGKTLAALLGGVRDRVPAGVTIGLPDGRPEGRPEGLDHLLDSVSAYVQAGYRRVKLKVTPGSDVEPVRAIRSAHPSLELWVDGNGAYRAEDLPLLRELDAAGVCVIEQPLPAADLEGLARVQAHLSAAVGLDESILSIEDCRCAIRLGSGRAVNVKSARVGGHAAAIAIHDLCARAGIPTWCGGMLESGIGRAHALALASLPNFRLSADLSASERYWKRDVTQPFALERDGSLRIPSGPGIGVAPDRVEVARAEEGAWILEA